MKHYSWQIDHLNVQLLAADDSIVTHLKSGQEFEPATLRAWMGVCAAGGTVVDIGCYTGVFSIVAAKLGCQVLAFEPMPNNFSRCIENFRLNRVQVDLRRACAADRDGPIDLKFNPCVPFLTAGASLIRPSGGKESTVHRSQGVTLDSLQLPQCAAIKIDVERGEPLVLHGAKATLERCRPRLLVEVLGEAEGLEVLQALPGYRLSEVLDERNWLMLPQ